VSRGPPQAMASQKVKVHKVRRQMPYARQTVNSYILKYVIDDVQAMHFQSNSNQARVRPEEITKHKTCMCMDRTYSARPTRLFFCPLLPC